MWGTSKVCLSLVERVLIIRNKITNAYLIGLFNMYMAPPPTYYPPPPAYYPPPPPPAYYPPPPPPPVYYPAPAPQNNPQTIIITGNNNNNNNGSPCGTCGRDTGNVIRKKVGTVALMWCICLLLTTGFACYIPLTRDSCKDTELVCNSCATVKSVVAANCCWSLSHFLRHYWWRNEVIKKRYGVNRIEGK